MAPTMKAVRFHAAKDVRVDTIPVPEVKEGWVRIKPAFCGICGTDLHEYLDGPHLIPTEANPHKITGEKAPLCLGHEFSGIVDQVGEGVTGLAPGDKVVLQPTIRDGTCRACLRGLHSSCDQLGFVGLSGWGGGMSEYTCAPQAYVKKLPDNIPLEIGALIEPLSVAWHAVTLSPLQEGGSALVLGGGPIGLSVIMCLLAKNCKNIIVAEVSKKRCQFASEFGAHHVLNPSEGVDVVEEVLKLTKGQGVDVCFDAAGVQVALDGGFKSVKPQGTVVNIALWGADRVTLDMTVMLFGERRYMAVLTFADGDFEAVIEAVRTGKIKPRPMITKVLSPNEIDEGFKALTEDKDNQVKILIDMSKV